MSRIKGGRASAKDVAVFRKPKRKAVNVAPRPTRQDMMASDQGAMDTTPDPAADVMPAPMGRGKGMRG